MSQLVYGQTDPPFWVLLDANGEGVTGHTFVAADVQMSSWDDDDDTYNNAVNIGLECDEGDNGFYYWKPSLASQLEHSVVMLYIHDSVGTAFEENRLIIDIGGDTAKLNSRLRG